MISIMIKSRFQLKDCFELIPNLVHSVQYLRSGPGQSVIMMGGGPTAKFFKGVSAELANL